VSKDGSKSFLSVGAGSGERTVRVKGADRVPIPDRGLSPIYPGIVTLLWEITYPINFLAFIREY
jgi:hypothetical protein